MCVDRRVGRCSKLNYGCALKYNSSKVFWGSLNSQCKHEVHAMRLAAYNSKLFSVFVAELNMWKKYRNLRRG